MAEGGVEREVLLEKGRRKGSQAEDIAPEAQQKRGLPPRQRVGLGHGQGCGDVSKQAGIQASTRAWADDRSGAQSIAAAHARTHHTGGIARRRFSVQSRAKSAKPPLTLPQQQQSQLAGMPGIV